MHACQLVRAGVLIVDRDGEWLVLKARTKVPSRAICSFCHLFHSCSLRKDADQMVPATQDIVSRHFGLVQCSITSFYASLCSGSKNKISTVGRRQIITLEMEIKKDERLECFKWFLVF